jgi:hypothetical protein
MEYFDIKLFKCFCIYFWRDFCHKTIIFFLSPINELLKWNNRCKSTSSLICKSHTRLFMFIALAAIMFGMQIMPMICKPMYGTDYTWEVMSYSGQHFDLWKTRFSIYCSWGHFVQQSEPCMHYSQLVIFSLAWG